MDKVESLEALCPEVRAARAEVQAAAQDLAKAERMLEETRQRLEAFRQGEITVKNPEAEARELHLRLSTAEDAVVYRKACLDRARKRESDARRRAGLELRAELGAAIDAKLAELHTMLEKPRAFAEEIELFAERARALHIETMENPQSAAAQQSAPNEFTIPHLCVLDPASPKGILERLIQRLRVRIEKHE